LLLAARWYQYWMLGLVLVMEVLIAC